MLAAAFGLVGFIMMRLARDRTSFLFGFMLGPLLDETLRRALTFSGGDPTVLSRRPASVVILLIGGACWPSTDRRSSSGDCGV